MAWPTFCIAIVHICRFCFIYCGLRFYAQSHSGNGHVHAIAPCSAHVLAQASPTMSYIPLVIHQTQLLIHLRTQISATIQLSQPRWHIHVVSFNSLFSSPVAVIYAACSCLPYCVLHSYSYCSIVLRQTAATCRVKWVPHAESSKLNYCSTALISVTASSYGEFKA